MKENIGFPLLVCGVIGIIGLLIMPANMWLGIVIVLVACAAVWVTSRRASRPKVTPQTTVAFEPQVQKFLSPGNGVDPRSLRLLKQALYRANLNPKAPVIVDSEGTTRLTTEQILGEMILNADARGLPIEELAKDIKAIYPKIHEHVEEAIQFYPTDLDLLTIWLANRALVDVRKEFEKKDASI